MNKPATVGVLADPYLREWQASAIEKVRAELGVDVPVVVVKERDVGERTVDDTRNCVSLADVVRFLDHARQNGAESIVLAEREFGRIAGDDQPLGWHHAIEDVESLADAEYVWCEPRRDGLWSELPADVVDRVAESCDVVIRFGFGLIRGDILTAPEFGVLSFHPADIRQYRGLGPWAVFADGRNTAGATLQRLNETIDGGEVVALDTVNISDCYTLWDVEERIRAMEVRLLTEGIRNLRDPAFRPTILPGEQLGPYYYHDEKKRLAFSGRIAAKNLRGRVRRRFD